MIEVRRIPLFFFVSFLIELLRELTAELKVMYRHIFYIFIFLIFQFCSADNLMPSGTIPILHINTYDSTPIDQKTTYIDAKAWLDSEMTDFYDSLGSEDEPLTLGIRGRGNSSWWSFDKKPYKLKFDKAIEFMGYKSNKHWALLHWLGSTTAYFREPLGYEAARRLGDIWVPNVDAVELILNGKYEGLYFLSDTVRVHKNRVDIPNQEDLEKDFSLVRSGWLVEIDNYASENQSIFYEPDGRELRLSYHSPEVLSQEQKQYIESEFSEIITQVYNNQDYNWLDIIDGESMAIYYIVTEILQNKDGFNGSFYMHKSSDSKWIAGPLWDLSYSLEMPAEDSYLMTLPASSDPKLIRKLLDNDSFREIIKQKWEPFYDSGTEWIDDIVDRWITKISDASRRDKQRWSFTLDDIYNKGLYSASIIKANIEWFNEYIKTDAFNQWNYYQPSSTIKSDYFDLMGRKVITPQNGIYILQGKKVIIRND